MLAFFLAALLPGLYWDQGPATASAVKQAGIERLYVPPNQVAAWNAEEFAARSFDPEEFTKITVLGVAHRIDFAGATSAPWVTGNGWRIERNRGGKYYYNVMWKKATLAAAEAYAYGADAVVRPDPRDLTAFGSILAFFRSIERPPMPELANIGFIDDGSDTAGEVLNLLARRNLLFRVVSAPDPKLDLNVEIGSKEYPKAAAANPAAFAMLVRQKLTDEKRLVRLYGSDVVLVRLTGDDEGVRVHLINYGGNTIEGLRVRVRGAYAHGKLSVFRVPNAALADYSVTEGGTEFTVPEMDEYAVVDLSK
jgi:hypothetical protein